MSNSNNSLNPVNNWKQYLNNIDYEFLMNFVENTKNGIKHDQMVILLGSGTNGKTTLINQIINYIGPNACQYLIKKNTNHNGETKLFVKKDDDTVNKYSSIIKEILSNDPYYVNNTNNANIIGAINTLDNIDMGLAKRIKVIHMTHTFGQLACYN